MKSVALTRSALALIMAIGSLSPATGLVWADEPDTAALRADIEILKSKLAKLENQVSNADFTGTTGIGEKAGLPTITLPSGLQGLGISGYADVSYIYNFAESDPDSIVGTQNGSVKRGNRGRVFDTEPNGFTPQAFELVLEKPTTDEMPIGFRTDLFFGDDAENIHSAGLGETPPTSTTTNVAETFDLQQAYVTAHAPIGQGVDFKIGKFVTLLGAEVIESPANWNFSRSYMFGYAIPFTHTGVRVTYKANDAVSVIAGINNGWDDFQDTNGDKTIELGLLWAPTKTFSLAAQGYSGKEQIANYPSPPSTTSGTRNLIDLVATYAATDQLSLVLNYDNGSQKNATLINASTGTAKWDGWAGYANYQINEQWRICFEWPANAPGPSNVEIVDYH